MSVARHTKYHSASASADRNFRLQMNATHTHMFVTTCHIVTLSGALSVSVSFSQLHQRNYTLYVSVGRINESTRQDHTHDHSRRPYRLGHARSHTQNIPIHMVDSRSCVRAAARACRLALAPRQNRRLGGVRKTFAFGASHLRARAYSAMGA